MNKTKVKKIGNIVLSVLMYIFLVICVFSVFVTVTAKKGNDGAAEIFGYQMRIVTSESMAKCEHTDVSEYKIKSIPIRSMVFIKTMPDDPAEADEWYRGLEVGDVLTFRYVYSTQVTITHRIVDITEKETGGFIIELAGDNKNAEMGQLTQKIDTSIPNNTNYVIGKVTGQCYPLGAVMSFLTQPIGIVMIIILPCFIIILLEVLKIAKVLSADKRKKEQDEKEQTANELEELRRKLAELQSKNDADAQPDAAEPQKDDKEATKEEKPE